MQAREGPAQWAGALRPDAAAGVPHIIATLYYAPPDGQALAATKREVPPAAGPRAQGRATIESPLGPAHAP